MACKRKLNGCMMQSLPTEMEFIVDFAVGSCEKCLLVAWWRSTGAAGMALNAVTCTYIYTLTYYILLLFPSLHV